MLYQGDCLEIMASFLSTSIDLILCDLPYGTTDKTGTSVKGNRIFKWDNVIPLDDLWPHYTRLLKPTGAVVLTADQPFTSQLVMSKLEWFKYDLIWIKDKTTGFLHANARPMKRSEDILVFSPLGASGCSKKQGKCMTYNPQGLIEKVVKKRNNAKRLGKVLHHPDHMGANNKLLHDSEYEQKFTNYPTEILEFPTDKKTDHPTQKPLALMEYLVNTYSNPKEIVLDNCMGSGTTGLACKNTGRQFIGIEKDPDYFKLAQKRINE